MNFENPKLNLLKCLLFRRVFRSNFGRIMYVLSRVTRPDPTRPDLIRSHPIPSAINRCRLSVFLSNVGRQNSVFKIIFPFFHPFFSTFCITSGDRSFRLSRYVYQKVGDMNLCEPTGFQWNRHTTVHVIVPGRLNLH